MNDFFGERMAFVQGEKVQTLHRIKNKLYGYAPKFVRGLPRLSLHYATTGTWQSDPNLIAVRDAHLITLREKHMFTRSTSCQSMPRAPPEALFSDEERLKISVNFQSNIALPLIQGVRESYIGVLSVVQYLMIVRDEHSTIRRRLFFDNIRDYQGDTD